MPDSVEHIFKEVEGFSASLAKTMNRVHDALDEDARRELEVLAAEQRAKDAKAREALKRRHEQRVAEFKRRWR